MFFKSVRKLYCPYGVPQAQGKLKQLPEDFIVHEQLGFELTGQGEHLFIEVEKKQLTTFQLIDIIARHCSVPARQIGYSGLKDKQAVTRQWLSIQLPGLKQPPLIPDGDHYRILRSSWHDKKLRVGVHRHNDFEIVVRDFSGDPAELASRIASVKSSGFANYFGEQRFGSNQDNVAQALKVLSNRHKSKRLSRQKKSLYLSALRSEVFNRILSHRIEQQVWSQPVAGDLFILSGSQSMFSEPLNDDLLRRYQELDLHCAISLVGEGESRISAVAGELEEQVIAASDEIIQALKPHKVKRAFRANRAIAYGLELAFLQPSVLCIKVRLERGVFFTSLLDHLILTGELS